MVVERDALAKRTFPAIRHVCEQREVSFTDIDLRWGVTDEEAAEGKVLGVCLDEIERSRPYFIGILGERYGWIPEGFPAGILETQPWLREQRDRSITELEIVHGVLANPEMAGHAFFYFRNPTAAHDDADFVEIDPDRQAKLAALKQRIRASRFPVREGFSTPEELAALVESDLRELVDDQFPASVQVDPIERERSLHNGFARERAEHYLGRQSYYDALEAHARGEGSPWLLVSGDSGSGKSALLSAWLTGTPQELGAPLEERLRSTDSKQAPLVFSHFAGLTTSSTDWELVCRRALSELIRATDIMLEVPRLSSQLTSALESVLATVAQSRPVIFVLDGANQLEGDGRRLGWLPETLPPGVRVVVSALPGASMEALRSRGCDELNVEPLEADERSQLLHDYLKAFGKSLADSLSHRLVEAPQCASPLFLRTLLDELRTGGEHERLAEALDRYLSANSLEELFDLVLARWEIDYEASRPQMVRDALCGVWASSRGLAEAEVLDLLGDGTDPLPQAFFSPLGMAMLGAVPTRAGRYTFAHDYMRKAVESRYLADDAAKRDAFSALGTYFRGREVGPRVVQELAPALIAAGDVDALYEVLCDMPYLQASWEADAPGVLRWWRWTIANSEYRLADAYAEIMANPASNQSGAQVVADVMKRLGAKRESAALLERLIESETGKLGRYDKARALISRASAIYTTDPELALAALDKAEALLRPMLSIKAMGSRFDCAEYRQIIALQQGRADDALELLLRVGTFYDEFRLMTGVAATANNMSLLFGQKGDLVGRDMATEVNVRLSRQYGTADSLARALTNAGVDRLAAGEPARALELASEAVALLEDGEDTGTLGRALTIVAQAGDQLGDAATAGVAREHSSRLDNENARVVAGAGDFTAAAGYETGRATQLRNDGKLEEALAITLKAIALGRKSGDPAALGDTLVLQAGIEIDLNHGAGHIVSLLEEALPLVEGMPVRRAYAWRLYGNTLRRLKRELDAAHALERSADYYETDGELPSAAESLRLAGLAFEAAKDPTSALALYRRAEPMLHELGDVVDEGRVIRYQAVLLDRKATRSEALDAFERSESILREAGNAWQLAETIRHKGGALRAEGRLDEAISAFAEAATLFPEEYHVDRAESMRQLSDSYRSMNDCTAALASAREAYAEVDELEVPGEAELALCAEGKAQQCLGNHADAAIAFEHGLAICRCAKRTAGASTHARLAAESLRALGEFKQAYPLAVEAVDAARAASDDARLSLGLVELGWLECSMQEFGDAVTHAEEASEIARVRKWDARGREASAVLDAVREARS